MAKGKRRKQEEVRKGYKGKGWIKKGVALAAVVVLIAVGVAVYNALTIDDVDPRVKVLSFFSRGLFLLSGAYEGSGGFRRWLWEGVQVNVKNGTKSRLHRGEGIMAIDHKIESTWERDRINGGHLIPIRIFLPPSFDPSSPQRHPVFLYFHGGGYVVGSIYDMFFDSTLRELSEELGAVVVGVEFRTAPEHKFPAALRDCYSVLTSFLSPSLLNFPPSLSQWNIAEKVDPEKIVMGGDSAGGTIALNVAQLSRDRGEHGDKKVKQIVLIYPCTYYPFLTSSLLEFSGHNYLMPKGVAQWFHNQYVDYRTSHWKLADEDDEDLNVDLIPYSPDSPAAFEAMDVTEVGQPIKQIDQMYLNPWLAGFHSLPSVHILITPLDPFRDESYLLAEAMRNESVDVHVTFVDGAFHGFFIIQFLDTTARAVSQIASVFRTTLDWYK